MDITAEADFSPRFAGSDRVRDKVAFITGAASGIGKAVCLLYAREGAAIAIGYHTDAAEAEALMNDLRAGGASAMMVWVDTAQRDSVFEAVQSVIERFGRIDILVCNASRQTWIEDVTQIGEQDAIDTFRVNALGYLWSVQAAVPHMLEGSAIIFTTSVNAYKGHTALIDYSATKGAELSLLRSLALNLADKGIRVNGVAPGPIKTPLVEETTPEKKLTRFGDDTAMGRPGEPAEVAPSFLFLACADSSYMTGQVLHPNGGIPVGS